MEEIDAMLNRLNLQIPLIDGWRARYCKCLNSPKS